MKYNTAFIKWGSLEITELEFAVAGHEIANRINKASENRRG